MNGCAHTIETGVQTATGKSILPGIAIGKIRVLKQAVAEICDSPAADPQTELARFRGAQEKAIAQQTELYEKALSEAGEEIAEVFNIHAMMLEDEDITEAIQELILDEGKTAEFAVKTAGERQAAILAAMDDPYIQARSADVQDITQTLLNILQRRDALDLQGSEPYILVARDLTPSETVRLDRSLLLGFITKEGSDNSHTAILARTMNIPAIVRCEDENEDWDGKMAVIDGYHGCVYVDPDPDLIRRFKEQQTDGALKAAELQALKGAASVTADGRRVRLYANIGSPEDVERVLKNDAEGVGLFRSEFLYLNSEDYPTEEEQYLAYRQVLEAMYPKQVIIRTCDIGADKTVDYMELESEANPALGFRAVRICLTRRDFFKTQLRALLRASAVGNLGVMFPMIISLQELVSCKELLEECRRELIEEGAAIGRYELGAMIETPAAVLIADELAQACDFFSIGTNDLTQYTCALDRQNAKLEPFFDPHHPAVLKEIQMVVEAGHRHGCWVGICGELGADLELTETFLRMGVDELSVSPGTILPLRRTVRELDLR